MLRRLLLLLAALVWPALAAAASAAPAERPPLKPALWEVTDGKSRAILFGTVHSLPRGVDWFRPHVVAALDGADRLVIETLVPEQPNAMLPTLMRLARLPAPRPVMERVPPDWQPTLKRAIDRLKPGPLDWYETWFVALTLTNLQAAADGFEPRIGVEAVLSERAKLRNIPIEALETPEEQLILFDALTEADQQQALLATLEQLDTARPRMQAIIAAWLAGDTSALADKINADFQRSPMLRQMLVEDRNARFAAWVQREMKAKPGTTLFVGVGAGHLAGPRSMQAELERRGLKVRQLLEEPPPRQRRRR
ncbi:MAG: TraB/GumN family protein [Sphingomonadaceae bacterium]